MELIFAGIYIWALGNAFVSGNAIERFLKATPSIDDPSALDRFKAIARRNMFQALLQIVLLGAGMIAGVLLILRHGFFGLLGVLVANAVVFAVGKRYGKLEEQARNLPAGTEAIRAEHRRISETWVKKALPDF